MAAGMRPTRGKRRAVVLGILFLLALAAEGLDCGYWAGRRFFERGGEAFEIYAVGESTAVGEPYGEKLAPAALAAEQFGGSIGGRRIRVVMVAERGQSIYPQSVAFERRLKSRDKRIPGVVLIYSGHNDAGRPYVPPSRFVRLLRAATVRSALLRDSQYLAEKWFPFLRLRTMESWEYDLRRIVEMSLQADLTPILATAVSNVSGIDPGLSINEVDFEEARAALDRGGALESRGRPSEALRYYAAASEVPPSLRRYIKYRMARCREALGQYAAAKRFYREVLDAGGPDNFGRASSEQNERLRALAAEYRIPLADVEHVFEAHSPHDILGDALFLDGHHPNIEGYRLLAGAYAAEMSKTFREPIRRAFASESDCLLRASFNRQDMAAALRKSGRWFFGAAARHTYPHQRLALARERFTAALGLEPGDYSAWLGLQLVALAERSAVLRDPEGLAWLGRHQLFYGMRKLLSCDQLLEIVEKYDGASAGEALRRRCSSFRTPAGGR